MLFRDCLLFDFSYMEESCEVEEGKLDALSKSLSSAGKEEACEITRMFIEQLIENDEEDVHYTISNARHYIDEHLAEDISVSSIAESLYITPNYFPDYLSGLQVKDVMNTLSERGLRRRRAFWKLPASRLERLL